MRCAPATAASAGALLLLLLVSLASADRVRLCTTEEETKYKPYYDKAGGPGCDTLFTFETCTDPCLADYEDSLRHAPNCTDGTYGRRNLTFITTAETDLKLCKDARANTTGKYFPQISPGAPKCNDTQAENVRDFEYSRCATAEDGTCSDECLKIIENKITSAPVCTKDDDVFTRGESEKWALARCLTFRKEDLKSNKVLMTVATASGEAVLATMPPSSPTKSAAAPAAGVAAAVISVAAVVVAEML